MPPYFYFWQLGVGIASCSGSAPSPLTGFGVVTLASLIPVNTVLMLGLTLPAFSPNKVQVRNLHVIYHSCTCISSMSILF